MKVNVEQEKFFGGWVGVTSIFIVTLVVLLIADLFVAIEKLWYLLTFFGMFITSSIYLPVAWLLRDKKTDD